MFSFLGRKIKILLLRVLTYTAKKIMIFIIIGLAVVSLLSEIKLWVKTESEKMIKQTFSEEVKKVYPSPKEIKEKLNREIIEKDLNILRKELDRLEKDFRDRHINKAILRLKVIENKLREFRKKFSKETDSKANLDGLNEITNKVKIIKNNLYKNYSAKFYKDNQD